MSKRNFAAEPPKPIFVIGTNRSGTKWLSNEISKHADIVSVQNQQTGIRETNIFTNLPTKFDLTNQEEYIGLIELWSATQFFQLTGVDKNLFYELDPRPHSCFELFATLMDEYARLSGKNYWLQKTCPLVGLELIKFFPNANFVLILRDIVPTLKSTFKNNDRRPGLRALAASVFGFVTQRKCLRVVMRRTGAVLVTYEALRRNKSKEIARVFRSLGVEPSQWDGSAKYVENTSFRNEREREQFFPMRHILFIRLMSVIAGAMPLRLLRFLRKLKLGRESTLCAGTFAHVYDRHPQLKAPRRAA